MKRANANVVGVAQNKMRTECLDPRASCGNPGDAPLHHDGERERGQGAGEVAVQQPVIAAAAQIRSNFHLLLKKHNKYRHTCGEDRIDSAHEETIPTLRRHSRHQSHR